MTWGQLRLQLKTSAPSVSLDLLDEFLNARYEQVLEATDWSGLKATGTVAVTAAYESGTDTATFTVGSSGVTGSGTSWDSTWAGKRIYRPGDTVTYIISAVQSTTSLSLDRAYEGMDGDTSGTIYSGTSYTTYQNIYSLPTDCATVTEIIDPVTGFPLTPFTKGELDRASGARTLIGDPVSYAVTDDTAEASPPVLHQVEFYPPPKYARGYSIRYTRSAYGFDGQSTSSEPLPFISSAVLLYGCRADIHAYLATQGENAGSHLAAARMYESKWAEELTRLLRVEHAQRRQKAPFQMADRFTRHRLERASRNYSNYWGHGQGGPN